MHVMPAAGSCDILILPGLFNSGPQHWQTIWERGDPRMRRVNQTNWDTPRLEDWVSVLDDAIRRAQSPVLVAHSAACALVARWSETTGGAGVRAAMLVAPADPEAASFPVGPTGFAPMSLVRLPFPSIVVSSRDDPYVTFDRARTFAQAWGSRLIDAGASGHIGGGLGEWAQGRGWLEELASS